jgi:hypothetical protein
MKSCRTSLLRCVATNSVILYVQKNQTKFFLYAGIKGEKENSQSLSNKLFSQWENGATPLILLMLI